MNEAAVPVPMTPRSKAKSTIVVPELGVWNCCIASRQSSLQAPLLIPDDSVSTFCLCVDLSEPSEVEPTLTLLQDSLVRSLIERPPPPPTIPPPTSGDSETEAETVVFTNVRTTTLYSLRSNQFGLAPEDVESADKVKGKAPDENDRKVTFALMICARTAKLSSSDGAPVDGTEKDSYKDKQAQSLLQYHLRRYAASLNAHLCFVDGSEPDDEIDREKLAGGDGAIGGVVADAGSSDDGGDAVATVHEQPTVSHAQLASLWRDLASGRSPVANGSSAIFSVAGLPEDSPFALVYGPENHNTELIESMLKRNANYPGHWDASKQSIWNIFPPEEQLVNKENDGVAAVGGDKDWLNELQESVAVVTDAAMKTPPPKKGSGKDPGSVQKTPNDAAVSNFFESLLK